MNPQLIQTAQLAEIVIGSIVSLGILAAGFGYAWGQVRSGDNKSADRDRQNLRDLLKSEQEKNAALLKEKTDLFNSLQAQITQNQTELAKLQGIVEAQTKMIEQYKDLIANRSPELEKILKEISAFLKNLSTMAITVQQRNEEIDKSTARKEGNVMRKETGV